MPLASVESEIMNLRCSSRIDIRHHGLDMGLNEARGAAACCRLDVRTEDPGADRDACLWRHLDACKREPAPACGCKQAAHATHERVDPGASLDVYWLQHQDRSISVSSGEVHCGN
jgi:hypothetical protein